MNKELLKVSLRKQAVFIPKAQITTKFTGISQGTSVLVANARKLGFAFSQEALEAIEASIPAVKMHIQESLKEIMGVGKNWTPLVKEWNVPTGESIKDHLITYFSNLLGIKNGTTLPCGHLIPKDTFPLERYNGCPFCGTPFQYWKLEDYGYGNKLTVLDLWQEKELNQHFVDLLQSKTALDASQQVSLGTLLKHFPFPEGIEVEMKETLMLVIGVLVKNDRAEEAGTFFKTPADILRYLWYQHTGFLQVITPKIILKRNLLNKSHTYSSFDRTSAGKLQAKKKLRLKYSRKEGRMVANWLNQLSQPAPVLCEIMHPKREMWVRFIRALRMVEFSKKKGFENLANLLDCFHQQKYTVTQGRINHYRLRYDADNTFKILKKRPGLFARSLFSNMLWFGPEITLKHFAEIADQIPARLLITLNMYAAYYFKPNNQRSVKTLGGTNKRIPANKFLELFTTEQLVGMQQELEDFCLNEMKKRFAQLENQNQSIFIEKCLYRMPIAIGDRSDQIQDMPSALMGTRFPVEGSSVRLFMQWGNDLPAQHLDMDLSCRVAYTDKTDFCSYSQLTIDGCKHSGDIQHIPNKVGTAEYIDINVDQLQKLGAKYVSFTCNAFTNGSLSPNMVVGWMNSKYPMKISKKSGVAYDPSFVQHQVRITQGLTKGLAFGVLDITAREIIWLEMSFGGQVVQQLSLANVEALLNKLNSKFSIGHLLQLKAEAQGLQLVDEAEKADEVYDFKWACQSAAVTQLLVDSKPNLEMV